MNIIDEQERQQLLFDFNNTDLPFPDHQTLHGIYQDQVAKTPNNIALTFKDEQLTYAELDVRVNQLAHAIRDEYQANYDKPMPVDTFIGLFLERSLEMVISILAVMKAAGAYVPISPEFPQDRIPLFWKTPLRH